MISRQKHKNLRPCYRFAAVALLLCALGGIVREFVLRTREVNGPAIRSTLVEASRVLGPDGQFVILNDKKPSGVFCYYIQRAVSQKVCQSEQAKGLRGQRLALVAVTASTAPADTNALFRSFQEQLGIPLTVRWNRAAVEVLLDDKDTVTIWVCDTGK